MQPGKLACILDVHYGIGHDGSSYLLEPGMIGLIVEPPRGPPHQEILTLLVSGDLIDVREYSVEVCDERYQPKKIK